LKKYAVDFLAGAVDDLDALYRFISEKASYEIADGYLARVEQSCLSLATFPQRGTAIPGRVTGLRTMGFEHRVTILFRVKKERVEILRILYGGRDLLRSIENLPEF